MGRRKPAPWMVDVEPAACPPLVYGVFKWGMHEGIGSRRVTAAEAVKVYKSKAAADKAADASFAKAGYADDAQVLIVKRLHAETGDQVIYLPDHCVRKSRPRKSLGGPFPPGVRANRSAKYPKFKPGATAAIAYRAAVPPFHHDDILIVKEQIGDRVHVAARNRPGIVGWMYATSLERLKS